MDETSSRLVSMPLPRLLSIIKLADEEQKTLTIKALGSRSDVQDCLAMDEKDLLLMDDILLEAALLFCNNSKGLELDAKLFRTVLETKHKSTKAPKQILFVPLTIERSSGLVQGTPVEHSPNVLPKYEDVIATSMLNMAINNDVPTKQEKTKEPLNVPRLIKNKQHKSTTSATTTTTINSVVDRRSAASDLPLAFDDTINDATNKAGNATAYRVLLRYGSTFKLLLPRVRLLMKEPSVNKATMYLPDDSPHIQQLRDIANLFNNRNPKHKITLTNPYSCNISTYTTLIDSNGIQHNHEQIKRLEVIADVVLSFVEYTYNAKKFFHIRLLEISIVLGDNAHENLKSVQGMTLEKWTEMKFSDRRRYYQTGGLPEDKDNNALSWCLLTNGEEMIIANRRDIEKELWYRVIDPRTASKLGKDVFDFTSKGHYALVLTYAAYKFDIRKYIEEDKELENTVKVEKEEKQNFMNRARSYLHERSLDVKGLWYDQGRGGRIHANVHIASELPLPYVRIMFEDWTRNKGMVTIKRIYEPLGWTIYASRNHRMLDDDDAEYREGKEVNKKFYKMFEEEYGEWTVTSDKLTSLLEYDIIS